MQVRKNLFLLLRILNAQFVLRMLCSIQSHRHGTTHHVWHWVLFYLSSEEMANMRLYPDLPPEGKSAWCFYPMTKRRNVGQNWYELSFEERKDLMHEHGTSGRKFAGRIVQLITASTGLDDWEWGVTLFGERIDDLKDVVYTMRYDTASTLYAEFGDFYTGLVGSVDDILARTR